MKIRKKILIILIGMLILMNLLIMLIAALVIQVSYENLEESYMELDMQRVQSALEDRLAKLESTLKDWSSWTETYDFAAGKNEGYLQENLMDSAFVSLQINLIIIVPANGNKSYAKSIDLENEEENSLPTGAAALWDAESPLMATMEDNETRRGIFLLPDRTLFVAARPILTNDGAGPAAGVFIMARYVDQKELEYLGDMLQLPLSLYRSGDGALPEALRDGRGSLPEQKPGLILTPTNFLIEGYAPIPDLQGKGGIVLRVQVPRNISANGRTTVAYFLSTIFLISMAVGAAVWILLRQVVIDPIHRLNKALITIERTRDTSYRIDIIGKDELSQVASAVNAMLDSLEKNQELLRKAHTYKALAQLAGGTAHEFNNILAIIQGSIEIVMDGPGIPAADRDILEKAYRTGIRGTEIVSQVLQYSKTTRSVQKPESLNRLVLRALDMVIPLIPANIALHADLAVETRPILANALQIEQIVLNLCRNAIDAIGGKAGAIEVAVKDVNDPDRKPKDWIELSVRDYGSGIQPSVKDRIFDPFFTTKEVNKGTGLGLSVVQGFVEQHGGTIDVSSMEGQGATFVLRFPAAEQALPRSGKGWVLFVSPDQAGLRLPLLALEASGRSARVESDPAEAQKLLMHDPEGAALVLVDQSIADGTGIAVCRSIAQAHLGIPLYLYRDLGQPLDAQAIAEAGIRETLTKPLTVRALMEILG